VRTLGEVGKLQAQLLPEGRRERQPFDRGLFLLVGKLASGALVIGDDLAVDD
jgi:hypothetical protein